MLKTESITLWIYFPLLLWAFPASGGGSDGGAPSREVWCVAKNNAEDAALQSAVEWACSVGGADCGAIQGGGACFDPSSVQNTASYAFNDYFRKHDISDENCNFGNNAAITSLNPSYGNCKFPSR
ncbi:PLASMODESMATA CALLOSE-BINDING PROTEIN 5-like [Abrus precatorius]|uniref:PLASMODESMATA CALLOSE-BINDING PROTEIN 5-like n=1 Tax=Abrus precatorius TaxID=3816 RepID=A0A8B8KJ76_ABRPR|nr:PLASMODESMATA CALLOSE-BINDING PROTEIN 5-like [Abrus precatorius]